MYVSRCEHVYEFETACLDSGVLTVGLPSMNILPCASCSYWLLSDRLIVCVHVCVCVCVCACVCVTCVSPCVYVYMHTC